MTEDQAMKLAKDNKCQLCRVQIGTLTLGYSLRAPRRAPNPSRSRRCRRPFMPSGDTYAARTRGNLCPGTSSASNQRR
jgi:hypothetical protein